METVYSLTLPIDLLNRNDGQGHGWQRSARIRKQYARILRAAVGKVHPRSDRVDLVVTRILGKGQRLWDADSVGRGTAKQLIDCLKEVGLIHDDGPTWIRHCDYRQHDGDRSLGPAVRIDFHSIDIVSTSTTGD